MNMAPANSGWRLLGRRPLTFGMRIGELSDGARRELLLHGTLGSATILGVRPSNKAVAGAHDASEASLCQEFWVRVEVDGVAPYEARVRQRVSAANLEWMQSGDVVCCRVDPGDRDRLVLYVSDCAETGRVSVSKILADGRRADATVLAAAPVAADYVGREDPVLRLDLELRAWDEPTPWLVRLVQPVPLAAIGLVDLGQHLEVAFFTVDHGESVAVDWPASLGED
ncbi:hypothetical protein [Nocardia sp. NPDC052316]|uniref:hypothetical protein n=1 Tax=Nocardia sp. NPDC052316 TaxID=3364329 RepID=UPI0037CA7BA0